MRSPNDLKRRSALAGAVLFVIALSAAPWLLWPSGEASANHPWYTSNPKHLYYQHQDSPGHGSTDEDLCVDDLGGSVGDASLFSMVYDTLLGVSPKWDMMNATDTRVDIWPVNPSSVGPCGSLYLPQIEIRVYADHPNEPSWCGTSSCVDFDGAIPSVNPRHHQYSIVYFVGAHVPSWNVAEYRRNINHEFGHVWGLKDPDYTNQFYGGCFSSWGVYYYSVMHQYLYDPANNYYGYCNSSGGYSVPYISYPQGADYENVIAFQLPSH